MRLGVTIFATDRTMHPIDLARAAEQRGFAGMYLPEHTHIPTSRTTPPPAGEDVLPEDYARTLDPLVALAGAAAVTSHIALGTGILLPAQREPLVTAKAVATLDAMSGGRVRLGVGFGWNRDEMANHGVEPSRRRAVTREHVLAMREVWSQDVASFDGEFVRFTSSWSRPKPVRRSGPPILIGGAPGATLFAHIAEYGDGWIPIGGAGIREALPGLRRAAEDAGRDPDTLAVVPFGTVPSRGKLDYYAEQGIGEVVLRVPAGPADEVLPVLDRYATELADYL